MGSTTASAGRATVGGGRAPGGEPSLGRTVRAGLLGGLVGAGTIWVYEAVVWVGVQRLMPLAGIPRNAVGLVFGKGVQDGLGALSYPLGTAIHLAFALAWGVLFALIWPAFRRRGIEATLVALFYAVTAWIVMHVAIAVTSSSHPDYLDANVIIGGVLSHIFFTVPLALVVKLQLG
jgi:predicted anti-sigma-YlaC factor YlaD